ncbi:MAG: hypothetical protein H8E86_06335 [Planctomycetes bacterium]|nr:hypothetical protein [Planctomycetota bacterium]
MQALHVVTPSDPLTTVEMVGLLKITQQQLGGKQNILVIGDAAAVMRLRQSGLSILGSIDGKMNASKTLISRFERVLNRGYSKGLTHIVGWGLSASSVVSRVTSELHKVAYVDGIDPKASLQSNDTLFIPTSGQGASCLRAMGIGEDWVSEPLVGVEPTPMIASQSFVRETLRIEGDPHVIAIVGGSSSAQEILQMAFRIKTTGKNVIFVLPSDYVNQGELIRVANQRDLDHLIFTTPPALRAIDVIAYADGVWVPNTTGVLSTNCVLEVLKVAWEGVPLAVQSTHPIRSVPMVGSSLAWADDQLNVSTWILESICGDAKRKGATELTAHVRSIAAPYRFVEGLQQRASITHSLRSCC